jgi:hypothetical protein
MTYDIRGELLLNMSNWQKNLDKASKQTASFGKSMKTISNGVKAAWAGVAVVGINQVGDAILEVSKKAAEDNRSMALLEEQMRRTWGNKANIDDINAQIDAMSNATGIVDDKLRPALIRIAAVTKSPGKAMKMLSLSTDIAAKSGQDLNLVSRNMAKFLGGNKTALDKLVPGLSHSGNRMKFLTENYTGFAKIAGANDPFGKLTNTLENFQEKLGQSFLPLINKFADWLASGESQKALDDIAKKVQKFGEWFMSPEGQDAFNGWMNDLKELIGLAGQFLDIVGDVTSLLKGKRLNNNGAISGVNPQTGAKINAVTPDNKSAWANLGEAFKQNVTINVNAPYVSGAAVLTAINGEARRRGVPLSKLLG